MSSSMTCVRRRFWASNTRPRSTVPSRWPELITPAKRNNSKRPFRHWNRRSGTGKPARRNTRSAGSSRCSGTATAGSVCVCCATTWPGTWPSPNAGIAQIRCRLPGQLHPSGTRYMNNIERIHERSIVGIYLEYGQRLAPLTGYQTPTPRFVDSQMSWPASTHWLTLDRGQLSCLLID